MIEYGRQQWQGADGGLSVPTTLGAAGDHDVASGLDCARSGPQVTDLGGRGDTRVVRAPNPRKVLAETDGQQRRVGGDLVVGVIEIVAGVAVAIKPRYAAYIVAAWLAGIIINLLSYPGFYDVALRDVGLLLAALTLGRLAFGVRPGLAPAHHVGTPITLPRSRPHLLIPPFIRRHYACDG